jgi:hypothetical protein
MVSGRWDLVGLLFAVSGFLLIAGPMILSGFLKKVIIRLANARRPGQVTAVFRELLLDERWDVWLIYYGALVLGAVVLLWARRWTTVIYNVDAAGLESALAECLGRLGVVWSRHGNRLVLSPEVEPVAPGTPAPLSRPDLTGGDPVILDVEPFPLMANATLKWRTHAPRVREELEAELAKALAEVNMDGRESGAALWLLGAAGFIFVLMFVTAVVLLVQFVVAGR